MSNNMNGLDILDELESACEAEKPSAENLVASCGRAHTEIKMLRGALEELPAADITFHNKHEFDAWNKWKAKYFDKEGQLK